MGNLFSNPYKIFDHERENFNLRPHSRLDNFMIGENDSGMDGKLKLFCEDNE